MAQYKIGTVAVTDTDATVVGTGTSWLANVAQGDWLVIDGEGVSYQVASVTDDTNLELTTPYSGTTRGSLAYGITVDFTSPGNIPLLKPGDIETAAVYERGMQTIQTLLNNIPTGVAKNVLINGDGVIAQRTLGSAINDDTYAFDRWVVISDGNGVVTPSQETSDVPTGARSAMKLTVAVANKKFGLVQIVEGKNCKHLIAATAALQAKFRASGLSNVRKAVLSWTGTEDSVTSDVVSAWNAAGSDPTWATNWTAENTPANISVAGGTWSAAQKAEGISIDTASTKQVAAVIWVDDTDAAISDYLLVTDVQLEPGSYCTAVERRPRGVELAKCQRYFCKSNKQGDAPGAVSSDGELAHVQAVGGTSVYKQVFYPQTMRTKPTITVYSRSTGNSGNVFDATAVTDRAVSSIAAQGDAGFTNVVLTTTAADQAVIRFHFAADAEL